MAKSSPNKSVPIAVCMAMLVTTGLGQLSPGLLSPLPDLVKCWSSFTSIPGCLGEVYGSFLLGQIRAIGPLCCTSITEVNDNCWPKMFPYNPFFPPLVKSYCNVSHSTQAIGTSGTSKISLSFPLAPINVTEITECWSSIINTEGCTSELYKYLASGQIVNGIGPACCKVVININNKCWPKMFPFNPFFPPLLNATCAKVIGTASTPTAI